MVRKNLTTRVSIYVLKEPCGLVRYVGATSIRLSQRLSHHRTHARYGIIQKGKLYRYPVHDWVRSLLDAGQDFQWRVIDEVAQEHRHDAERFWVMLYRHKGADLLNEREPTGNAIAHAVRLGLLPPIEEQQSA